MRALEVHATYQCQRTGVCCGSGWDIPVESVFYRGLRDALDEGRLRTLGQRGVRELLPSAAGLPEGYEALLGQDASGRCLFFEEDASGRGRCAVHHQLGAGALPLTCRHFPRVCLVTPESVDISLSHYCPTAAGMLFSPVPARIMADPAAFPSEGWYEGLDARRSPGPLLRPGVFLGWDAHRRFERFAVETLSRDDLPVAEAVTAVAAGAERARGWTPAHGPLEAFVARSLANPEPGPLAAPGDAALWQDLVSCVPPGLRLRANALEALQADPAQALDEAELSDRPLAGPSRRYLAARVFASWLSVQGQGLRTTALGARMAWVALRVQAGRLRSGADSLDAAVLKEAIRAADLVLVHLAAPEVLATRLARVEAE